jgi:hypothetical protein
MHELIAFVGFKASGKNTAAAALFPFGFVPLSFADALKDALAAIFCWDREMLEGITDASRVWREQIDPWWAEKLGIPHFTPRWAMMHIGTEVMRYHFNYDLWVHNVERRLLLLDAPAVLIDGRFPNEIVLAHRYGGRVYRIQRGPDPEWRDLAIAANAGDIEARAQLDTLGIHASEFAWIGHPIDGVIVNDNTIDDLHAAVRQEVLAA